MKKDIPESSEAACPECRGSGYKAVGCNLLPCPECRGKGTSDGAIRKETASGASCRIPGGSG